MARSQGVDVLEALRASQDDVSPEQRQRLGIEATRRFLRSLRVMFDGLSQRKKCDESEQARQLTNHRLGTDGAQRKSRDKNPWPRDVKSEVCFNQNGDSSCVYEDTPLWGRRSESKG